MFRPPPIPACVYPVVYRSNGKHEFCGKQGEYQNVCGSFCAKHWPVYPNVWYQNGKAFGWDDSRPDPG